MAFIPLDRTEKSLPGAYLAASNVVGGFISIPGPLPLRALSGTNFLIQAGRSRAAVHRIAAEAAQQGGTFPAAPGARGLLEAARTIESKGLTVPVPKPNAPLRAAIRRLGGKPSRPPAVGGPAPPAPLRPPAVARSMREAAHRMTGEAAILRAQMRQQAAEVIRTQRGLLEKLGPAQAKKELQRFYKLLAENLFEKPSLSAAAPLATLRPREPEK